MTREEAIAKLEDIAKNMLWGCGEYSEALDTAIKALEQKLTTKNNLGVDCISREQALNEFCIYNPYDSIGVDKVRNYLKALPSVTPQEPKTGHWIDKEEKIAVCSCCNRNNLLYGDFCKWCGAKMIESEET